MDQEPMATLMRCLHELRLAAVRNQYESVVRQATAESWGYREFLLELLQRECQQRQQHRIERLVKASKLSLDKSWSALDLKRLPTKVAQQLRSLLSGDFLDRRENVLVFTASADAAARREGQRPAAVGEDSCQRMCDRPGCYVTWSVTAALVGRRFCSLACRLALRRVLDREGRYRQRRRRWRRERRRRRGPRPDTS